MILRWVLFYIFTMGLVFVLGYRLTDVWFQKHLVPYPFELYGVAIGLALVFWTFALFQWVDLLRQKRSTSGKGARPTVVKVNRMSEVELFK